MTVAFIMAHNRVSSFYWAIGDWSLPQQSARLTVCSAGDVRLWVGLPQNPVTP